MTTKQKHVEIFLNAMEQMMNHEGKEYSDEEKGRAAYALNLCTVSVSQIVNYNDINILEQEYEAILNNLNLENIPKDEALLNILKQILDTVTFFRIMETDKQFIDKEYQHKMKNALWSSVPQFGLLVSGGNWKTMAVSLATQVGIGYMNYRRIKSDAAFERERAKWQLGRSAIEQLNGLRRELFDAAWRLADEYQFPDAYRLTETQIEQYNRILMDDDLVRKYDRLDSIKDKFSQYVPFWYQIGNTAARISYDTTFSDITRNRYKGYACEHFEKFCALNHKNILRVDQIAAACALEYIDLLDFEKDADKIDYLLDIAVANSDGRLDVMQLCAITYLKKGDMKKASGVLRQLVNEDYNTVLNAQLLSTVYVNDYVHDRNKDIAKSDYEILKTRVAQDYLFPFPQEETYSIETMERIFYEQQQALLISRYKVALSEFIKKYTVKFNRIFQTPDKNKEYPDRYFSDDSIRRGRRLSDLQDVFANRKKRNQFYQGLGEDTVDELFDLFNEMYEVVLEAGLAINEEGLKYCLNDGIIFHKNFIQEIGNIMNEDDDSGSKELETKILNVTFRDFVIKFFEKLDKQLMLSMNECTDMASIKMFETKLRNFCTKQGLSDTEKNVNKIIEQLKSNSNEQLLCKKNFSLQVLGKEFEKREERKLTKKRLLEVVEKYKEDIIKSEKKTKMLLAGDEEFSAYFDKKLKNDNINIERLKERTIVVIDDNSILMDNDLLVTMKAIYITSNGKVSGSIPFSNSLFINDDELVGDGFAVLENKKKSGALSKLTGVAVPAVAGVAAVAAPVTAAAAMGAAAISSGVITATSKKDMGKELCTTIRYSNKNVYMKNLYDMIKEIVYEIDKNKSKDEHDSAANEYSFLPAI